jgi:hypothetical protein
MKVGEIANTIDGFFVSLLADVDQLRVPFDGTQSLSGGSGSQYGGSKTVEDTTSSTKFNWAGERLKNGGGGTSTQVITSSKSSTKFLAQEFRWSLTFCSHWRSRQPQNVG